MRVKGAAMSNSFINRVMYAPLAMAVIYSATVGMSRLVKWRVEIVKWSGNGFTTRRYVARHMENGQTAAKIVQRRGVCRAVVVLTSAVEQPQEDAG